MTYDPLQKFRPAGTQATAGALHAPSASLSVTQQVFVPDSGYRAYGSAARRQARLQIRPCRQGWERVSYHYLYRIVDDQGKGTQIGLVYSFAVVLIRGLNLQPIVEALDGELCEFIEQFDARRWAKPADGKTPLIEDIQIHVETRVEAADKMRGEMAR